MVSRVQDALGEGEVVVGLDDERARDAEIMLVLSREREALERSAVPGVRWLHAFSTGIDGFPLDVIDGRQFTCSRGANAVPIAEFVLASMLAFVKRFPETWLTEVPERWGFASLDVLAGKTVGLVGVGAIGTEVARRALAFDMRVRRVPAPVGARTSSSEIELCDTLEELLAQSDHVVIAAPATPETYHLIDADALAAIKPGAHIVNIARGSLVDQDALLAALDDGRVACASLDTVDPEPLPEGHPLLRASVGPRRARTCRGARPTRSAPRSASSPRTCAATAPARNCTASSTSKPATDPPTIEPASTRRV